MTFDLVAFLRRPDLTVADLERLRDESRNRRPYVGIADQAIADAAQAEIERRAAQ